MGASGTSKGGCSSSTTASAFRRGSVEPTRRSGPVHVPELEAVTAAYRRREIGAADWDDLLEIDVAALAFARAVEDERGPEILVVLELSRTVNAEDVRQIHRRAEILRRLGYVVDACVDGEQIRGDARELATQLDVVALVQKVAA